MNPLKTLHNRNGSSAIEFVLTLPFILLFTLATIGIAALCIRGEVIALAASRVARVAKVYQDELANVELYAMLTPEFVDGISVEWKAADGSIRTSNWNDGQVTIGGSAMGVAAFGPLSSGRHIRRTSSTSSALVPSLSNDILQGGDTPSPYCREGEGYRVCGYSE